MTTDKTHNPPKILQLPIELLLQIFSRLNLNSHIACSRVCTLWRDVIESHGQTFPCNTWTSTYDNSTNPAVHTLLRNHELELVVVNGQLVKVRLYKSPKSADPYETEEKKKRFVCTFDPRSHYIMQQPLFKFVYMTMRGPRLLDFYRLDVKLSDPLKAEGDGLRRVYEFTKPETARVTLKGLLDQTVAAFMALDRAGGFKVVELRTRMLAVVNEPGRRSKIVFQTVFMRGQV